MAVACVKRLWFGTPVHAQLVLHGVGRSPDVGRLPQPQCAARRPPTSLGRPLAARHPVLGRLAFTPSRIRPRCAGVLSPYQRRATRGNRTRATSVNTDMASATPLLAPEVCGSQRRESVDNIRDLRPVGCTDTVCQKCSPHRRHPNNQHQSSVTPGK